MPEHRRYTFRPGSINRFTKKYGIRFNALQVYAGMICMREEHPGQKFFILKLTNAEGRALRIPYKQGSGVKGLPELKSTIEMLAADCHLYFDYDTVEAYCEAFGKDEIECEKDFEIMQFIVGRTREFLGEEAFGELMKMHEGGFEMEGDRGWRSHQTCGG